MANNFWEEHKKSLQKNKRLCNDEALRAINHFEKVMAKEITLDEFLKERGGYGLRTRVNLPKGQVIYNEPKEHEFINGLINMFIENNSSFCYIKFISEYTKPNIKGNYWLKKASDLKSEYVIYKYGLLVYFIKNGKFYRFIFAPYIDECERWMTHFALINDSSDYNYIKIDKPKIKKDIKNRRKMPTRYLMVSLGNGMQASIPDYGSDDKMN